MIITDEWLAEIADPDEYDFECPKCGAVNYFNAMDPTDIRCRSQDKCGNPCKWHGPPKDEYFTPSKAALAAEVLRLRGELGYLGYK